MHDSRPVRSRSRFRRWAPVLIVVAGVLLAPVGSPLADPYVTEPSGVRWNDVGGLESQQTSGLGWSDLLGVRWNDVGGVRWNDVGGVLFTDAAGISWSDAAGVRWNDVGSIEFHRDTAAGPVTFGLDLLQILAPLPDTSAINVVVSYEALPDQDDLDALVSLGVLGGTIFHRLPMVVINATKQQIAQIAALDGVRSIFANKTLSLFDAESAELIGLDEVAADPDLAVGGQPLTGQGVTIAVLDTGVDAQHPDLPYASKVVENVSLAAAVPVGPGFVYPATVEGVVDTDPLLGHGTFVASVAAGSGAASNGLYAGVAPGASILALSAGDLVILQMLEGFDYILEHGDRFGVKVVNCSWGTQGWFDPEDPINIATRLLYDEGISVVFAAGNHGAAPDTLNPYAVAPWVVGVGATRKDGRLSDFSSRGIFEELLYHPTLVAPGETIVGAKAGAVEDVTGIAGIADPSGGQTVPPPYAAHYTVSSGTSFAAPHVAGVIALMLEAVPTLSTGEINRILQRTATPMPVEDRSAVGAGRLDAWAAATGAVDPARPFGTHVPSWLDQRPYRIEHLAPVESAHTLPAGGVLQLVRDLDPSAVAWKLALAWGNDPGVADLDMRVFTSEGVELARADSINGSGLFGRAEGVQLLGELPQQVVVEIRFKTGTGGFDQAFFLHEESAVAELVAFDDVLDLEPSELDTITRAVSRNLIGGRGTSFAPHAALERDELAHALAVTTGSPQRIPSGRTFDDVLTGDALWPYVETVAGWLATDVLIDAKGLGRFRPGYAVRRLDYAVAAVRGAGRGAEAAQRAGEPTGLLDDAAIPDSLKGYVHVALETGLIAPVAGAGAGADTFDPAGKLTRLDACASLLTLLELSGPHADPTSSDPGRPSAARDRPARPRGAGRAVPGSRAGRGGLAR